MLHGNKIVDVSNLTDSEGSYCKKSIFTLFADMNDRNNYYIYVYVYYQLITIS